MKLEFKPEKNVSTPMISSRIIKGIKILPLLPKS